MSTPRKLRCPMCRTHLDLESMVMDEAQDALMKHIYSLPQELRLALVPYLALFRPEERDPTPERMLRLALEVAALESDQAVLAAALSRAREAVLTKWKRTGARRALSEHTYLMPVLETVRHERAASPQQPPREPAAVIRSHTAAGVAALEEMKRHG